MKLKPRISVPSHSTVAAYLALFGVVAGGSAYAAATIGSGDIDKNAVLSKHIKDDQVKAADIAKNAKSFQAVAVVKNEADGTEFLNDELKEKGFESVRSGGTGSYCLVPNGNLDPKKNPPLVTIEYNYSSGDNFTAMWDITSSNVCEEGEYDIQTFEGDTGANTDDASFVIVVP